MKKRKLSWTAVLVTAAVVLCMTAVLVSVAFGDNITSSDPLISLSYLNGIFKTDLMSSVSDAIDAEVEDLEKDLSRMIGGVRDAIGNPPSPVATHSTISVGAGSTFSVTTNTSFLMTSGSATVKQAGLLDVTTGLTVAAGEALQENHFYIAASRTEILAGEDAKFLVRQ